MTRTNIELNNHTSNTIELIEQIEQMTRTMSNPGRFIFK